MANKGFFIPVNDVPNEDELMGDIPVTLPTKVTEATADKTEGTDGIAVTKNYTISQIDFVWGFFLFDFPEIYSEGNRIYFNGEVSKDSVNQLKREITRVGKETLLRYHELGIHKPGDMKLELVINSPGGAVSAGWDLIDFMNDFYIPIHTIGTGTVASMGVTILLAGTKRYLTKNTHVLIHQFRAGVQGKRQDIIDYMKHFEDIQKQIVSYMVAHTKMTESKIIETLSYESWFNAEEALSLGVIDSIY